MSDDIYEQVGEYMGIPIYTLDESKATDDHVLAAQMYKERCILEEIDNGSIWIKSINPETLAVIFDFKV